MPRRATPGPPGANWTATQARRASPAAVDAVWIVPSTDQTAAATAGETANRQAAQAATVRLPPSRRESAATRATEMPCASTVNKCESCGYNSGLQPSADR